jgi:hypothetical protein
LFVGSFQEPLPMSAQLPLSFEVELGPGDKLTLPPSVASSIGPGHWRVTISSIDELSAAESGRGHSAFLASYAPEDEGLYDDYPAR